MAACDIDVPSIEISTRGLEVKSGFHQSRMGTIDRQKCYLCASEVRQKTLGCSENVKNKEIKRNPRARKPPWNQVCAGTIPVAAIDFFPAVLNTEMSHESTLFVQQHHTLSLMEAWESLKARADIHLSPNTWNGYVRQWIVSLIYQLPPSNQKSIFDPASVLLLLCVCLQHPPLFTSRCAQSSALTAAGHIPSLAINCGEH